ncbi:Ras GTPase [Pelomyxa schiedti]|nr:Ras GTPase [Pelomyxa schiedti]
MSVTEHKLVVLGGGGVGKSSLVLTFTQNAFVGDLDPTIEDSYRKSCLVDSEAPCLLDILDTAGEEEYSAMSDSYIRTAQAFLLVYSVTSRNSFKEIPSYRDKVLRARDNEKIPMILVATKCDLETSREVTTMEGADMAKSFEIPFIETSAKTRINIEQAFFETVRQIRRSQHPPPHPRKKEPSNCCIS